MAVAGARFADSLLGAMQGQKGVIIEPSFVDSPLHKDQGIDFGASDVELGPNGLEMTLPIGKTRPHERGLLDVCLRASNLQRKTPNVVLDSADAT